MPDSLSVIQHDPEMALQEQSIEAAYQESVRAESSAKTQQQAASQRTRTATQNGATAAADTMPKAKAAPARQGIMLVAHQEPQMPVSPRTVGSPTTSWVIMGLVALFLLVSMRYRNNFRFLRGIRRDVLSKQPANDMFQETVRETSFLILLNLLCIASAGVLLFGAFEIDNPLFRTSQRWYEALGGVTLVVAGLYAWQWLTLFITGRVFRGPKATRHWLRGLAASQGLLGMVLFPLALLSIFYSKILYILVITGACAYVLTRILFICKGFRIFVKGSASYLPFFYYLCSVEIAPVVLTWTLAYQVCTGIAGG